MSDRIDQVITIPDQTINIYVSYNNEPSVPIESFSLINDGILRGLWLSELAAWRTVAIQRNLIDAKNIPPSWRTEPGIRLREFPEEVSDRFIEHFRHYAGYQSVYEQYDGLTADESRNDGIVRYLLSEDSNILHRIARLEDREASWLTVDQVIIGNSFREIIGRWNKRAKSAGRTWVIYANLTTSALVPVYLGIQHYIHQHQPDIRVVMRIEGPDRFSCQETRLPFGTVGYDMGTPDEVRAVQSLLRGWGFELRMDGDFGPETQDAVMRFQRSKGLSATGTVDSETFKALIRPCTFVHLRG